MASEIAVVGVAGRFPGARTVEEHWQNVLKGVTSLQTLPHPSGEDGASTQWIPSYGALAEIDLFDADHFRVLSSEAVLMDPQHRLFLECAAECFSEANQPDLSAQASVYAGCSPSTYLQSFEDTRSKSPSDSLRRRYLNDPEFLPTQTAYRLNLRKEAVAVQTACSSSLLAIYYACESLRVGRSDISLAGGASVSLPQDGYLYQPGMIYSRDGRCLPFDEDASGTVEGNGVGVVCLKRLEDALRDGNFIYAVVKGGAVNNDGGRRAGYTAPSVAGQVEVLRTAYRAASLQKGTLRYIEAHGTGTTVGDAIELEALQQALSVLNQPEQSIRLGSVKASIGHLKHAAGVAGFISAVMVLSRRQIPAQAWISKPHPLLKSSQSMLNVSEQSECLPDDGNPVFAGVSSFGIGGTNVHLVLGEGPGPRQENRKSSSVSFNRSRWWLGDGGGFPESSQENDTAFIEPKSCLWSTKWVTPEGKGAVRLPLSGLIIVVSRYDDFSGDVISILKESRKVVYEFDQDKVVRDPKVLLECVNHTPATDSSPPVLCLVLDDQRPNEAEVLEQFMGYVTLFKALSSLSTGLVLRTISRMPSPQRSIPPISSCIPPLGYSLAQENRSIHYFHTEIAVSEQEGLVGRDRKVLLDELMHLPQSDHLESRIQNGEVQTRVFRPCEIFETETPSSLKAGAVVVIFGGTGQLGSSLAGELIRKFNVRAALVGRREHTQDIQSSFDRHQIPRGHYLVLQADVTDSAEVRECLRKVAAHWSQPVAALIHAAGVVNEKYFQTLENAERLDVVRLVSAKLKGALTLYRIARALDDRPDVIFLSSLSSYIAGVGYGAYAAANRYLDVFAESNASQGWRSFCWDSWKDVGGATRDRRDSNTYFTSKEGGEVFSEALCLKDTVLLLMKDVMTERYAGSVVEMNGRAFQSKRQALEEGAGGPKEKFLSLVAAFVSEESPSLEDDFFELGGDSMALIELLDDVQSHYGVELDWGEVYENPSLEKIYCLIQAHRERSK